MSVGRRRRAGNERGASAVEFGLLLPLLMLVLFGIVDYGLWFNDSLNLRQGVREGARQGVVHTDNPCTESSTQMERLKCLTKQEIGAVTGATYVKIAFPDGWERGERLLVCGMVEADALTGLVPLPEDGLIRSKTEMSIEVVPVTLPTAGTEDVPPSGSDWSWCA